MNTEIFEQLLKQFKGEEGFKKGSSFTKDLIKSRIELLELHKRLVKVQASNTADSLKQALRSAMENERFDKELIDNIIKNFDESTIKMIEKL